MCSASKHTDVHVHVCVLIWKWMCVSSPCSALHPHSPWLHSTRPLELSEAHGGCSSLCLLSCVSEWALMCVCVHMCVYVFTAVCQPYKESMVKLNRGMFSTCRAYFIIRIWKFSFLCAWEISIHRCASVWEAHSEKPCVRASTDAAACAHTACSCKPVSVGLRKGGSAGSAGLIKRSPGLWNTRLQLYHCWLLD